MAEEEQWAVIKRLQEGLVQMVGGLEKQNEVLERMFVAFTNDLAALRKEMEELVANQQRNMR